MHPVAIFPDSTCCYQVATEGRVLGEISGKVHLFPLELFPETVLPREAELP
jgi:hypothetical protein